MLKIKLYVILSILLFHLFDESCAIGNRQRGSGSKSNRRRTNNCPSVSSRGPPSKIDCKYFFFFFFFKKKSIETNYMISIFRNKKLICLIKCPFQFFMCYTKTFFYIFQLFHSTLFFLLMHDCN